MSPDNEGSALQRVIRDIKGENFFVGLRRANHVSVCEYHENVPPGLQPELLGWP